jgi:hypothetical protein
MSGVLRRPLWTIQFVSALTLAALAAALSLSIGAAAQSREDRADSQQLYFDIPFGRTKRNSNSDVIDNLDVAHLTIAAVLTAALRDGDCFRIVRRIEPFEAVLPKQVVFHNSPRYSTRHKTNLGAVPLDWHPRTRQYAPSAITSPTGFSRTGLLQLSHRTCASGANGSRKPLLLEQRARHALGELNIER